MMKSAFINTFLSGSMAADATYLPVFTSTKTALLEALTSEDDYMYLAIRDAASYEVIKVQVKESELVITERGAGGTTAASHGQGSCISAVSPLSIQVMKDLICTYSCCEDDDCQCEAVAFAGEAMGTAVVGVSWSGSVVFSGDLPMTLGVSGAPSWMTVTAQNNMVILAGTPTSPGHVALSVAATNCNGTKIATHTVEFDIASEPA